MGPPDKPYEGWPKAVKDISASRVKVDGFIITLEPAADQTDAGTGGGIAEIKVEDTHSGKILHLEAQCVGARLLENYKGYPQVEIWGRGGGGTYSRVLYRVDRGEYKPIRDDLFDVRIENAKRKDIKAESPDGSFSGYYTGTMYPEANDQ